MRILFKIASRGRPEQLLKCLDQAKNLAEDASSVRFLLSLDRDDQTVDENLLECLLARNVDVRVGISDSKIHACNRDIDGDEEIIMLGSDDMFAETQGWDAIVKQKMAQDFPDTDGALFFLDGYRRDLCTFSIVGRAYYNRFGYIYHPSYKSFYCDDEFTIVGRLLGRLSIDERILFRHHHCTYGLAEEDQLYKRNGKYFQEDKATFHSRAKINFDLKL